jgi:cell division septation protein DedD
MIEKYLADALADHQAVTVPNLGTFYLETTSASLDDEGEEVAPPSAEVNFTEEALPQAIPLTKAIRQKEGRDILGLDGQLELFAQRVKQQLQTEGTATVEGLGYISQAAGQYRFQQEAGLNLYTPSYGLPPLKATRLAHAATEAEEAAAAPATKERNLGLWAALIPLIILGIVGGYILLNEEAYDAIINSAEPEQIGQPDILAEGEPAEPIDAEVVDVEPNATEEVVYDEPVRQQPVQEQPTQEVTAALADVVTAPANRFFIIAGSFSSVANAKKGMNKARSNGFPEARVVSYQGKHRLSVGDYPTKTEASAALPRAQASYNGAWVYSF